MKAIIPQEIIEQKIFMIRGHKVIFDRDLAMLYGIPTKVFNQAVKRNKQRFPKDFMFQLSKTELGNWRSQFVTSNSSAKMGLRRPPYVFTEQGVAMLSSVLNSERAIQVNIAIMRAFVKLKEMLSTHKELAFKLRELERKIEKHDEEITDIFNAIRQMMIVEEKPKKQIGFKVD